ncbi:UDP-glucuronosyltransferase 1A1-like [Ptychodera flava]|uniref:UDP-glucuronosyltransferase 1A1-like n=1 Tax=Ptychodera flava TaxID=63121 RepID=UPI00396A1EDF
MAITVSSLTKVLVLLFFAFGVDVTLSARLLVLPQYGIGAEENSLLVVADSLARHGHDITVLLPSCDQKPRGGRYKVKTIGVQMTPTELESTKDFLVKRVLHSPSFASLKKLSDNKAKVCQQMFDNPSDLNDLRGMRKFDLAILDTASTCGLLFATYFEVPFVGFALTTAEANQWHGPVPTSYVPQSGSRLSDQMKFSERLHNSVEYLVSDSIRDSVEYSSYRSLQIEKDLSPHLTFQNIQSQAKLILWNSDFAIDFPRPLMPHVIPIGGVTAGPGKPLPKELNDFVEGSGELGVVVFSHLKDVGPALGETIASALAKLPQKVVWRYSGDMPSTLGKNTKVMAWLPQNDILANKKTRLLVTHCGPSSVQEGVYHGVPMLCLPFLDEHFDNAVKVKARGIGDYLDIREMTSESLHQKMTDIITDERYRGESLKLSSIRKHKPLNATDTAVYWVNHALKHGTDHLISQVPNLRWYQYYLLDVIAFLLAILALAVYIVKKSLAFVCRKCRKKGVKAKLA